MPGCALPPQTAALRAAAEALGTPPQVELTATPFFPQTPYHCGPAALATLLGAAGLQADMPALVSSVFLPSRQGSLQLEMLAAARRAGAVATRLPRRLDALLQELAHGRHPVGVLLNLGLRWWPRWHYAVLIGYQLSTETLWLRSGTERRAAFSFRTFENTWARAGYWAFTALAPDQLPHTALDADALQAALGFERSAKPAQAARAYRAFLARWPDSLLGAIGLGNSLQASGDAFSAAKVFEAAARQHDSTIAWLNLAELRLQLVDSAAALQAAQQALQHAQAREPRWLPLAEQTLAKARRASLLSLKGPVP